MSAHSILDKLDESLSRQRMKRKGTHGEDAHGLGNHGEPPSDLEPEGKSPKADHEQSHAAEGGPADEHDPFIDTDCPHCGGSGKRKKG